MTTLTRRNREPVGVDWMTVAGELDLASAGRLELELAALSGPVTVVDLREVAFIDVAGVRALLRAQRAAAEEGREVLILAGRRARRVLRLMGGRGPVPAA
jgi:anti-anti-sigma factor